MAEILSGKIIAAQVKERVSKDVVKSKEKGIEPKLVIIKVGDDPASEVYVKGKIKDCIEVGIIVHLIELESSISEEKLLDEINYISNDETVHGVLVQLPLPKHISESKIIEAIPSSKDVDGFSLENIGKLWSGANGFVPCTPAGCIEILKHTGKPISGKHAVIIGRSNIVGKPMAALLLNENATVTICHSKTNNLKEICKTADILIVAVGKPKMINEEYIKPGAIVIDVGINRDENNKLCGDVDFASAAQVASFITPVPGGAGLMTRAMLLQNVVEAAKLY